MHSIELLLDPASDAAVRDEWAALGAADLPTQAAHPGGTNAPHVTLAARPLFDATADDALTEVLHELPLPVDVGPLVVFGAPPRGLVLARLVVATPALLALHVAVHRALPTSRHDVRHSTPGHWTPHVTLANRLTPEQLARALEVLADRDAPPLATAELVEGRRWDPAARTITDLSGRVAPPAPSGVAATEDAAEGATASDGATATTTATATADDA